MKAVCYIRVSTIEQSTHGVRAALTYADELGEEARTRRSSRPDGDGERQKRPNHLGRAGATLPHPDG